MIQNPTDLPWSLLPFLFSLTHSERSEVDRDFRQSKSAHMKCHDGWRNVLLDRF